METINIKRKAKELQQKSRRLPVEEVEIDGMIMPSYYRVTGDHDTYLVDTYRMTCDCPWGRKRHHEKTSSCSHLTAALLFETDRNNHRAPSLWANEEDAKRQHRRIVDMGDNLLATI